MGERRIGGIEHPWRASDASSRLLLDLAAARPIPAEHRPTENEITLGTRHGLLGMMAHHDNEYLRAAALPAYSRLVARQKVMDRHLRRVLEALWTADVCATVLKGSHLAHWVYRNPAQRTTTDIDLLVPSSHVAKALRVLEGDSAVASIPPKTPKADKRNIPMADPNGVRFTVDLHWDLFSYTQLRGSAIGATEWAWSRARLAEDHPLGPLWELPEEARIAFLATHALLDHRFRMILFRDLAEVAQLDPDWDAVAAFCRRWGLGFAAFHAFSIASNAVDAGVPQGFLDSLQPRGLAARALQELLPRTDLVAFDGHSVHPVNLAIVLSHDDFPTRVRLAAGAPLAFPHWRERVDQVQGAPRTKPAASDLSTGHPLVVHVLPIDLARGAQTYAQAIRNRLDGEGASHRTMTLFDASGGALDEDVTLGLRGRWRNLGLDPAAVARLWTELRHLEPDVVVAHGGESLKYAALAAPRSTRLAYLKIGTSRRHLRNPLRRLLYTTLLRRFDLVMGVSQEMVDEAHELLSVPRRRLAYIPNGRDPEPFTPVEHGEREEVRLCFVGHITRTKRPDRFIELVRDLRSEGLAVGGVMAGDGPLLSEMRRHAVGSDVELIGRCDDVPTLMAGTDVFVFTSMVEGEGMPGVLIEAGLAGLPVVSTDVPGARSVIEDGVSGFVVPVDDVAAMRGAVARLITDAGLRRRMGAAARARCLEGFTLDASSAVFETALASILPATADRSAP